LLPVSVRPLFSFGFGSRKRTKLSKKEKRRKGFRALRSATKGAALESRDLLKKVDQNFSFDNAWSKNASLIKTSEYNKKVALAMPRQLFLLFHRTDETL
jgi:hypothetical protein